jgi:transcriptional regulator with XRE-family HTH domain
MYFFYFYTIVNIVLKVNYMLSRVKQIIEIHNLTPSRFADHIGVPRSTISHILSGRNKPSLEVVQKILEAFPEIKADWLVQGKGTLTKETHDLFSQIINREEKPDAADDLRAETETERISGHNPEFQRAEHEPSASNSNSHETDDVEKDWDSQENRSKPARTNSGKQSVKIIIVYADGTYSEYSPA